MSFQYPRADRAHCDGSAAGGSIVLNGPFSILVRAAPSATTLHRSIRLLAGSFSILVRIVPIGTMSSLSLMPIRMVFQYPRADRAHCDRRGVGRGGWGVWSVWRGKGRFLAL